MTPADRAMKNAFDESVQQVRSPPRMASASQPLLAWDPERDLTSSRPDKFPLSKPADQWRAAVVAPHYTHDQFRKLQSSPPLASTPDIDYKRVRRKPSSFNLSRGQRKPDNWPLATTPFSPSLSASPPPSLSSLDPPPSLVPHLRPGATSPSLASTIDTSPSTPLHAHFQHSESPSDLRSSFARIELDQPIRTKRKFPSLSRAKRLPRYTALGQGSGSGSVWEVHAAVIDLGAIGIAGVDGIAHRAETSHVTKVQTKQPDHPRPSARKGLSVRFEDAPATSTKATQASPDSQHTRSVEDEDRSHTSTYTLSKFKFPAPPGYDWTGAFGHLKDLTPSTSLADPATLHYRGASFDVVNPHESLLLGHSDFETPAEIDGLLDDYFNRSSQSLEMAYNDKTGGEMSAYQQSLHTSSSGGRQRILYEDPESARRAVMRLPATSSRQTVFHNPRGEPSPELDEGAARAARQHRDPIDESPAGENPTAERSGDGDALEPPGARAADRASSVYPRSQYSNPFDLEVSDDGNDNLDARVGAGNESFYANRPPVSDHQAGSADDEDSANPYSTQSTLGQETTLDRLITQYDYARPRGISAVEDTLRFSGYATESTDVEGARVYNPFSSPQDQAQQREIPPFWQMASHRGMSRRGNPPTASLPTPQNPYYPYPTSGFNYGHYPSPYTEPQTNDQTYGNTDDLLQYRPQQRESTMTQWPTFASDNSDDESMEFDNKTSHSFFNARSAPTRMDREQRSAMPRSSSCYPEDYPDDDDDAVDDTGSWYTASRPNLHQDRNPPDDDQFPRPSQDSYANTSITGNRLSMPPQEPVPEIPPWATRALAQQGTPEDEDPDAREIRRIIQREIQEKFNQPLSGMPKRSNTQSMRDMRSLERYRQTHPDKVKAAINASVSGMGTPLAQHPRPPQSSISKFAKRFLGRSRVESASGSDTQGLLSEAERGQLAFSPTANTFQTTHNDAPIPFGLSSQPISSPITSPITQPAAAFIRDQGATFSNVTTARNTPAESTYEDIEMRPLRRPGQTNRAGITSQRQLRPLTLATPSASPSGPLNDRQLAQASARWTISPTNVPSHGIGAITGPLGMPTATAFGLRQEDGSLEPVSMLMHPDDSRTIGVRRLQKELTRPWLYGCGACPVTALAFGLGAFDFHMRQMTSGRVNEMAPAAKKEALRVYLPLGTIMWVMVILALAMIVVAMKR
ncbi:uncharacterized protein LTR77_004324 [Saxophila tyrrhenica]|uniref:Uncharacterized protein n=1 Tax=Saxophila tyrrhenica TaxID=1690608 RepID=A0AAV9PD66_9PEZI|nr:hypothetical protein LTR77_004324 [Saxophila tyrrhenica]